MELIQRLAERVEGWIAGIGPVAEFSCLRANIQEIISPFQGHLGNGDDTLVVTTV